MRSSRNEGQNSPNLSNAERNLLTYYNQVLKNWKQNCESKRKETCHIKENTDHNISEFLSRNFADTGESWMIHLQCWKIKMSIFYMTQVLLQKWREIKTFRQILRVQTSLGTNAKRSYARWNKRSGKYIKI